ncbi:hypothetical protein HMPREF9318_01187 [Streptococcus urinalis FB127-CNA-2]|uniref:Acetyltransferase, GNAT family n=1 Tax=Streptococcus urinalis 2285-97 TaxID=764291 RepID=G5KI61_9STRE|nr:GNAT family N-acetyltransferase [Streptococcus urinalis]EHJ56510.1 acetyltransferase, GNAT family [Streptococcus urinalis 2285-97]EKS20549.1 hypothetical protein HMPREF9318_01187 [Streptococcus urinalis FB127-CNA-2]VEF31242.1 GNAT family acetyltransferase [Streptococcus urinalis]
MQKTKEIIFEEAQAKDAKLILEFFTSVLNETDFIIADDEFIKADLLTMEAFLSYNEYGKGICLIARMDQQVIGLLNVNVSTQKEFQHIGDIFIAVRKSFWGQGIASTLMELMSDWVSHAGYLRRLELNVQKRNETALALYRKFGFQIEGEKERGIKLKEGEFLDVYQMGKLID